MAPPRRERVKNNLAFFLRPPVDFLFSFHFAQGDFSCTATFSRLIFPTQAPGGQKCRQPCKRWPSRLTTNRACCGKYGRRSPIPTRRVAFTAFKTVPAPRRISPCTPRAWRVLAL